jgi:hypothetical protein
MHGGVLYYIEKRNIPKINYIPIRNIKTGYIGGKK